MTTPALEPTPRSIYGLLRREIITLRLRPGVRLSENELATRFGTSRAPVREALIRLVEDGLIDVRPQRGSFVSRISLSAMEKSRFVREALEVAVVRRAAERGIDEAAQARLEGAIAGQIEARNDPERFSERDDQFHHGLAEAASLGAVWDVIEREKAQFDRIRYLSLPNSTPIDVLLQQHRDILSAILNARPGTAERAVRVHMHEVLKIAGNLASRYEDLITTEA